MREVSPGALAPPADHTPGLLLLHPETASAPVHPLTEIVTTVGRAGTAGLVLASNLVSSTHAVLSWDGSELRLEDHGSRNGTFVNGSRVGVSALADGDRVRFGDVLFKVVREGALRYVGFGLDGSRPGEAPASTRARMLAGAVGGFRMAEVERQLDAAAASLLTVLLLGETGTGKEVFARHVHARSGRKGPFVPVHCGAIPPHLIESELFGASKGAYSGAVRDRPGHFRAAHGGTLFLDELGDMPLEAQTRLLRVLQDRVVVPVGESHGAPVDVRVIAATHRDLPAMAAAGAFRQDVLQRIKELVVELPPLRARREDLLPLCRAFLLRHGRAELGVGGRFMAALAEHPFPGNVRELEALLKRAVALAPPGTRELGDEHLPAEVNEAMKGHGTSEFAWGRGPESRITSEPEAEDERPAGPDGPAEKGALPPEDLPPKEVVLWLLRHHRNNVSALARAFDRKRSWVVRVLGYHQIEVGRRGHGF